MTQKYHPCYAVKAPITLAATADSAWQLNIHFSQALQGCEDWKATLHTTEGKAPRGLFSNGKAFTLDKP